MSELLFECYNVPSVAYGVDSLFSLYNNIPNSGEYPESSSKSSPPPPPPWKSAFITSPGLSEKFAVDG